MTLLSYKCAETSQALPSWRVRGGHGSTPTFTARAFFLHFGGAEKEGAGKLLHAWMAERTGWRSLWNKISPGED